MGWSYYRVRRRRATSEKMVPCWAVPSDSGPAKAKVVVVMVMAMAMVVVVAVAVAVVVEERGARAVGFVAGRAAAAVPTQTGPFWAFF